MLRLPGRVSGGASCETGTPERAPGTGFRSEPYSEVFPGVAAVVLPGGIALALRARRPMLLAPLFFGHADMRSARVGWVSRGCSNFAAPPSPAPAGN